MLLVQLRGLGASYVWALSQFFLAITIDQPRPKFHCVKLYSLHLNFLAYCSQSTPLSPCNHKNINNYCRSDWRDQGRIERGTPTPGRLWM